MIKITATKLRNNLFDFLNKVTDGETISIQRKGVEVALIIPPKIENWRDKMKEKPKLLVPADEAFKPMEDIWFWISIVMERLTANPDR